MRRMFFAAVVIALTGLIVPFQAAAQGGTTTHVVQPGENLFRIALQYDITVEALMQANGLTDEALVMTGQTLVIPGIVSARAAPTRRVILPDDMHTVRAGETLLSIGREYGVTPEAIMQLNGLTDPEFIFTGQVLAIPVAEGRADLGLIGVDPNISPIQLDLTEDLGILPAGSGAPASAAPAVSSAPAAPVSAPITISEPTVSAESAPQNAAPQDTAPQEPPSSPPQAAAPVDATPAPVAALAGVLDPTLNTPDLGILGPGAAAPAAPAVSSAPDESPPDTPADSAVAPQDLGILAPEAAAWVLAPGILTTGDSAKMHAVYLHGLTLGNNPHAFSKIGDCNSEVPFFLAKFDRGEYDLGPYGYLQPTITYFAGSFERSSAAVWTGNHAWAVFDPIWSNPAMCVAGETPIACEFRVNRPSVVLVRLGTNEAHAPDLFEQNLRLIVEFSLDHGVIPVLGTKADRLEGSDAINDITRRIADEYGVPLWDFGRIADTIPGRGLVADGFHMTWYPLTYSDPLALQAGHTVQNLMALMALNTVLHGVMY